jgi:hypothetical protein
MKRSLLITFVVMLAATQAFAAAGSLGVFNSLAATSCALANDGPAGPNPESLVYICHTGSDGTTGSGFKAVVPPCSGFIAIVDIAQVGVYLGAEPAPAIPSQVGASAGYGGCRTGVVPIVQIFVSAIAPASGCCLWTVTANTALVDPNGDPWTVPNSTDCSSPIQDVAAAGGSGIVSANVATCPCNVDTKDSTWGGVKELFRQGI